MTRSELEIIIKRRAAITVTVFAALLAINTLIGGSNSSKILSNTIASNNVWAWYQAKNMRSVLYGVAADTADDKKLAQYYHTEVQRMRVDMQDLSSRAKALEDERDHAKTKSPFFTYAGSLLQIGIVLSTAAILAVAMPLFWASVAVGSVGTMLFFYGLLGV
jgi:hypothetical protein